MKEEVINQILNNPVYKPNSGMRIQVAEALARLPLSILQNLMIIINCRETAD